MAAFHGVEQERPELSQGFIADMEEFSGLAKHLLPIISEDRACGLITLDYGRRREFRVKDEDRVRHAVESLLKQVGLTLYRLLCPLAFGDVSGHVEGADLAFAFLNEATADFKRHPAP